VFPVGAPPRLLIDRFPMSPLGDRDLEFQFADSVDEPVSSDSNSVVRLGGELRNWRTGNCDGLSAPEPGCRRRPVLPG
jgi:hypothetical protein